MVSEESVVVYPQPIYSLTKEAFDQILIWVHEVGASDIELVPNDQIWIRLHGEWWRITPNRELSTSEISLLLNQLSNQSNAASLATSGQDKDFTYEVTVGRGKRIRFRGSATGCIDGLSVGISIVLRTIPELPPKLETLGLPDELIEAMKPKYGLVLVTGPVGSGKTTTLFALLRHITETQRRNTLTYEDPIEFDLVGVPGRIAPVVQTQIPQHLSSFDVAPRNSLRRAGDVVLFGESRDKTTIRNMSIEAETGVAVYSTGHTNSVAETISRFVREFPWEERDGMTASLNAATRVILHQRLVQNRDGTGRVALREWLIFDDAVRKELSKAMPEDMIRITDELVRERGHSLMTDAKAKLDAGLIAEREYEMFAKIRGEG